MAQFFVEHRGVGWLAMVATLLWGWFAYQSLPQQEDPPYHLPPHFFRGLVSDHGKEPRLES